MEGKEESLAMTVINESLKLPFVKVNRKEFLMKMFGDEVTDINRLVEEGPQAFFFKEQLDKKANSRINSITVQSSAVSFATGLPGGVAMAATIPADIAQFYAYSLKLAQEISYIYGYEDIWNENGQIDDNAKNTLILYLGIMLGVTSAGSVVRVLSSKLSAQAFKKIPQKALTKTLYYPIIKKVLAIFGTKLTKSSFAKGISKVIPVVGGVVSGGLNLASMKPMATRLKNELSQSIEYDDIDLQKDLKILKEEDVEILGDFEELSGNDSNSDNNKHQSDVFEKLEKAHELLQKNIINEAEYKEMKQKLLSEI